MDKGDTLTRKFISVVLLPVILPLSLAAIAWYVIMPGESNKRGWL